MARRTVLTGRQRSALFSLPQREADLLRHYTLSDEDLQNIEVRRRPRNKLGFALQLCVLRYPGRLLAPGEFVPPVVVDFIGRQLHLDGEELGDYAVRAETLHEHLAELRRLYGFRSFSGGAARELVERLREEAPQAQSNEDLVRRFVEACRRTRTILPATTTIERLCADALVDAERRIEARIAERVPPGLRRDLEHLLEETVDAGVTRFVWLRQFEPGSNSADANRLLDRLEHLRRLAVPEGLFGDIPPHRITRLRRQGERYFADGLRELPDNRRLASMLGRRSRARACRRKPIRAMNPGGLFASGGGRSGVNVVGVMGRRPGAARPARLRNNSRQCSSRPHRTTSAAGSMRHANLSLSPRIGLPRGRLALLSKGAEHHADRCRLDAGSLRVGVHGVGSLGADAGGGAGDRRR